MSLGNNATQQLKASAGTLIGYDLGTRDYNGAIIYFYDSLSAPVFGVAAPLIVAEIPGLANDVRTTPTGIAFSSGLWIVVKPASNAGMILYPVVGHVEYQ